MFAKCNKGCNGKQNHVKHVCRLSDLTLSTTVTAEAGRYDHHFTNQQRNLKKLQEISFFHTNDMTTFLCLDSCDVFLIHQLF